MPVQVDITSRPDLSGTIPIDTASQKNGQSSSHSAPSGQPNDVAGVLRRNQACLACRRRKLKCDAVRPHCSTCVRSYRHLLRTAPGTQPVLSCEYDDANERENTADNDHTSPVEDDEDARKKKRKTSGARGRKRDGELDVERERLTSRIAELEAQLANRTGSSSSASGSASQPDNRWSTGTYMSGQANSPTAFLEMLSSAASTAQGVPVPAAGMQDMPSADSGLPSFIPMWTSADRSEATGLTPYFPMPDPDMSGADSSSDPNRPAPSPAPQMLSPNGVFNFSPAPSASLQWPPTFGQAPSPMSEWRQAATDPSVQSVLQNAVRDMGALAGVAQIGGSALTGPMMGPGASTPAPASSQLPRGPSMPEPGLSMDVENPASGMDENSVRKSKAMESDAFQELTGSNATETYANAIAEGNMDSSILVDLFWPGWPPNLPEPPVVTHLVEMFFELVPNMPRMLHRARFLSRLALPPTHSNFPHPSILHGICALTATWCQPSLYEGTNTKIPPVNFDSKTAFFDETGKQGGKPSSMPFSLRQAAFGKDAVLDGLNTGNRLFDVVRAMIILSRVFIDDTRMLECWTYCGLVSRMILPLGLNVRSAELSLKSVMLPPAVDALEREERRIVVWMAMYHDTIASAASGWGTCLALDELTVALPVSAKDFEAGYEDMEPNPQDLESLDLYIKHPVQDSFVMALKGSVLLNRVNKFARKWKNRRLRENDDLDGMQRPEFRELANAIACLQMSFPSALADPTKLDERKKLDVNLITAHVLPHAAIICLYEPFADITDPNDQPARRIINGARAVINVIQTVVGVVPNGLANIAGVMHSASSVALVTAARTCLLFYRHALNVGDAELAESFRMDIETARMCLAQYGTKFKIGYHHAQLIEYFLDRATNPTYEKLAAHYPEHPRPGALVLTPSSNFGLCILNALNIKRGYWKIANGGNGQQSGVGVSVSTMSPNSVSPNGVTPNQANGYTPDDVSPPMHRNSVGEESPIGLPGSVGSSNSWGGSGSASVASASLNGTGNSQNQQNEKNAAAQQQWNYMGNGFTTGRTGSPEKMSTM